MKKKRKSPSRLKYELNHPTVSFRNTPELDGALRAVKQSEGKSNTDVMKIGLGLLEVKAANEKEAREKGYKEGFMQGYKMAKSKYCVIYLCKVCGKTMEITSAEEKAAARKHMQEDGWGHADCIDRG